MLGCFVTRDVALQVPPHKVQRLDDEQRRSKILVPLDGRDNMFESGAQPSGQRFVVVDLCQIGEKTEVRTQHLGLRGAGLDRAREIITTSFRSNPLSKSLRSAPAL